MLKVIIIAAPLVMILGICIIFYIAMLGSLSPCGRHKNDDNDPPDGNVVADPNKDGSSQEDPHLLFNRLMQFEDAPFLRLSLSRFYWQALALLKLPGRRLLRYCLSHLHP